MLLHLPLELPACGRVRLGAHRQVAAHLAVGGAHEDLTRGKTGVRVSGAGEAGALGKGALGEYGLLAPLIRSLGGLARG
jgi:hypothetical protein